MTTLMLRAVSNTLWLPIRRNRWRQHIVTRDLSKTNPRGFQFGPRTATVATAPSANAVIELHHETFITAVLYGSDWPGGTTHALRLDRIDYDAAVLQAISDPQAAFEWCAALAQATCRQPFHAQANRHNVPTLRRNGMDDFITTAVALVLERIAAVTKVQPISEATLDDYLIEGDDIDVDAVRAALALTTPRHLV